MENFEVINQILKELSIVQLDRIEGLDIKMIFYPEIAKIEYSSSFILDQFEISKLDKEIKAFQNLISKNTKENKERDYSVWTNEDGFKIKIKDMTNEHIDEIKQKLCKNIKRYGKSEESKEYITQAFNWLEVLEKEVFNRRRRKYGISEFWQEKQ